MSAPLLEIEGLTFRYRRASEPALRDLSLTVEPGEVLLVAGPSGCGKSTLIRAINGLIPHAYRGELSGVVRVNGRPTGEMRLREIGRHVGTVLQDPERQIVASTVASELAFGPENVGIAPDEIGRRMDRVAKQASIGHLLDRTVDELSGGERQLITVAGALMLEPSLLVVDEPLANLDPGDGPWPAQHSARPGRPRHRDRDRRASSRGCARPATGSCALPRRWRRPLPRVSRRVHGGGRPA